MIKGRQIQATKNGEICLTLQRDFGDKPATLSGLDWQHYLKNKPRAWKIIQGRQYWLYSWPEVVKRVNIALAKNESDIDICGHRTYCRIRDEVIIEIYRPGTTGYLQGKFKSSDLDGYMRIPLSWWAENIDDLTEDIVRFGKAMVQPA